MRALDVQRLQKPIHWSTVTPAVAPLRTAVSARRELQSGPVIRRLGLQSSFHSAASRDAARLRLRVTGFTFAANAQSLCAFGDGIGDETGRTRRSVFRGSGCNEPQGDSLYCRLSDGQTTDVPHAWPLGRIEQSLASRAIKNTRSEHGSAATQRGRHELIERTYRQGTAPRPSDRYRARAKG